MAKTTVAKKIESSETSTDTGRLHARGANSKQRVLWMAMFAQGLNGRRGLPYVLVGEPGSAKTSSVKQLAAQANLAFEGVLGSLRSPIDFLGVPVPRRRVLSALDQHLSPDGESEFTYMHYAPAGFSVRAAMAQRAVILLDEVNTCPPSVQAALLRVLFEGVVGELQLPPGVRMILAMNETKDAAGGWDIAPPLANRMGWIEWDSPTPGEFTKFLLGGQAQLEKQTDGSFTPTDSVDPAQEEAAVDAAWGKAYAQSVGEVSGFLHRRPELLLKRGKEGARQWPSPRTWEMTTRALAGSYVYDLTAVEQEMACAAFVGTAPFGEFFSWRKEADLPDPEKLLDGQASFAHKAARLDRTAAVLTACTAIVTPEKQDPIRRKERSERLWKLIRGMTDDATDVCLPACVALCNARLMIGSQEAFHVLAKIEPVMSAAGITRVS